VVFLSKKELLRGYPAYLPPWTLNVLALLLVKKRNPGADSGQREKNEIVGKSGPKNGCSARPWGRRAIISANKL
jgi:hypothetical protein